MWIVWISWGILCSFRIGEKIFGKTDKLIKITKKHRFYKAFPIYQL